MDTVPFVFVDVFSDRPLEGNPLAVVPDADAIDEPTMRRIAREFNQSETTFLLKPAEAAADWHLRSFTAAGHEVTGAGHNALGAWWWLAVSGRLQLHDSTTEFRQKIASQVLPLQVVSSGGSVRSIVMQQSPPEFGETVRDARALADALGLEAEELLPEGRAAQVVSTGAAHLLIPVRDRSAIERAKPDAARLLSVLRASGGEGAYLFCRDVARAGSAAHARFFNPTMGISEDAATGTAAGPLGAWLVKEGLVRASVIRIEQGFTMGRPSLIEIKVGSGGVSISGRGCVSIEGTLRMA
ncbi:MAG TPA: PhzF family phenazine biosynthesis protein [Terracidiphilus sp.]|nr:PhzF family phenazine biosynthesis protein [Terracidiphilus sp.]